MPSAYSPAQLGEAERLLRQDLLRVSAAWAAQVQERARADAPWTDRGGRDSVTGLDARHSLEGEAGVDDHNDIVIVLRSTRASVRQWHGQNAPVAAFLELGTRYMHRKYDVIGPTLDAESGSLRQQLQRVLDGLTLNVVL